MIDSLSDQDVRRRLVTDLDTTFFVEAGAGTGKTRELVARIVALVAHGRVKMEGLAAITFTDAAAAELRDRVRQGLAAAASDAKAWPDSAQRECCARAASEVDLAAISTIHAFAGSLLRSFPLDAGLPPGFATWDDIQHERAFDDRFRQWLYDEVPGDREPARRAAVARALALGMTPDQLRELARALQEHYDLLRPGSRWTSPLLPQALAIAHQRGAELVALKPLTCYARNGEADPLVQEVLGVQFTALRMQEAADEDEALQALQRYLLRPPKQRGNRNDWDDPREDNGHPVTRIKDTFKEARKEIEGAVAAHRTAALSELLVHLAAFTHAFAAERKVQGAATFHDLLVWARDLLRDHPDVRRAAANRYQHIFVDEFQDTDPLQAELVCFLAAEPDQVEVCEWPTLRLQRGKLCLVGDPKQSIYRFRRADIAIYDHLYARTGDGAEKVVLRQTRRSVAPVVAWVNHHFGSEMQHAPGVQASYEALIPRPALDGLAFDEADCGVRRIGGPMPGKAPERWAQEAEAVARLAHHVVDQGWLVTERNGDGWRARSVRYSDICVLLPTRTNLRRLERAFERHDVPYRVESGSLILQTQEVRDLLSCLRAIDDPSDQVALVAALRSPACGCSDADLLEWVDAGGQLSYESPGDGCEGPVRAAFENLKRFHDARMQRSSAETVERFIHDRGLAVQAFGQPRPREAWRRLRYVAAQARRLAASGQTTLRAFLDWLERLQRAEHYDAESAVPEGDEKAVRLMTVHGSKGLEFPVVILTGLGSWRRRANEVHVSASRLNGQVEVRCGEFQTQDYDQDREKQLDAAERLRLLYVATTRAREHLVLSLYHANGKSDSSAARRILETLEAAPGSLCEELKLGERAARVVSEPAEELPMLSPEEHAEQERQWQAEREECVRQLARERVVTPSGLNRKPHAPAPEETQEDLSRGAADLEYSVALPHAPRGGSSLGLAVHAVLQWLDLESFGNLDTLADWAACEHGVSVADVRRYARQAAESEPVRRAVSLGRYWREVPVAVQIDGTLLEGAIDLLCERKDGALVVVDYKTDRVQPATVAERAAFYRLQGGAYALAVEQSTGRKVGSVELVFAALERGGPVVYDSDEVSRLTREVRALLDEAKGRGA